MPNAAQPSPPVTTGAPPDPPAPDRRAERAALPLARRIARTTFPLWLRPTPAVERLPMVGWFDPGQLFCTALKSLISLTVGEQTDRRSGQALAPRRQ
jgi:hypothetical protein